MSVYVDTMSTVLNKIERRLGLIPLTPHLPDIYNKPAWAKVIVEESIVTFSRYFPRKIPFRVTKESAPKKDGWYYINESFLGSQNILGVGDLDWSSFSNRSLGLSQQFGYGVPDVGLSNFSTDDIMQVITHTNYASMFNNNIYIDYQPPNRIKISSIANRDLKLGEFVVFLYVTHSDDLKTIAPTKMETFEALAQADVATFLSNNLKYWDGLETVFSTLDLKMSNLENEASKRESVVEDLKNSYISAGNEAIPYIITV